MPDGIYTHYSAQIRPIGSFSPERAPISEYAALVFANHGSLPSDPVHPEVRAKAQRILDALAAGKSVETETAWVFPLTSADFACGRLSPTTGCEDLRRGRRRAGTRRQGSVADDVGPEHAVKGSVGRTPTGGTRTVGPEAKTACELFLEAWEAAGKPPVRKLRYPRFDNGTPDRILFSHEEVRLWARDGETFRDNLELNCVTLGWTYTSDSFVDPGGYAELFFDRDNPIRRGRRGRLPAKESR